jgi:hypothetical protein
VPALRRAAAARGLGDTAVQILTQDEQRVILPR